MQFSAHNATQLFTELKVLDFAGVDIDDAETPVDQLIAQLEQTLATLERVTSESLAGLEDTIVTMSFGNRTLDKRAIDSVQLISMPSLYVEEPCHPGKCTPCPIREKARCYCGKEEIEMGCGEGEGKE